MMAISLTRTSLIRAVLDAATHDPRIEGILDYGSASEGRADEWSDVDLALFVRDDALEAFEREWKAWAGQFGRLLLAYVGGVGHPWAVYDAEPLPLRADFAFHPASKTDRILAWPNAPTSVDAMLLLDRSGGALAGRIGRLVGQPLGPPDPERAFDQVCGDIWYYLLRTLVRLYRGDVWAALYEQNARSAITASAALAYDVSEAISKTRSWPWPKDLAGRVLALLEAYPRDPGMRS